MSAAKAYACDGPDCDVLTARKEGERYPKAWARLTLALDDLAKTAAFHDVGCAHRWVDQQLCTTPETPPAAGSGSIGDQRSNAPVKS